MLPRCSPLVGALGRALQSLALDFIKDEQGNWWFIQIKGFTLTLAQPSGGLSPPPKVYTRRTLSRKAIGGGRGEGRQRSRSQSAERKGLPGSGGSGAIAGAAGLRIDKWRRALFMHTTILYDNDLYTPSDEGGSDDDSGSGSSDGGRARSDAGSIMLGARTGGGRGGGGKSRRGKQWRRKRNIVQRLVKCHFCKAGYVMQGTAEERRRGGERMERRREERVCTIHVAPTEGGAAITVTCKMYGL